MLNPVSPELKSKLERILPASAFPEISEKFMTEPRGLYQGTIGTLVAPDSTDQVSQIIFVAAQAGVAVVPFGGGTGLVGGQVLPKSQGGVPAPIVLSLSRMRKVRQCYPKENVLEVEAGVTLAEVQAEAAKADRAFPLSIASEGTAQIGGVLATNAGGVNVLRYGMARDQVFGIEAVMADGKILNGSTRLRKDNTGYDLRHLLIGSEGTLGIITSASLKLSQRPSSEATALFSVESPTTALELLNRTKMIVGEGISAFELISGQGLKFVSEKFPQIRQPWLKLPDWSVLLHLGFASGLQAEQVIDELYQNAADLILDGVISQSKQQSKDFWSLREAIPAANKAIGAICSFDISVPLSEIPNFIRRAGDCVKRLGKMRINCFGHLGDGNLHYNIFPYSGVSSKDYAKVNEVLESELYSLIYEMNGSISAEHGIGRHKVKHLKDFCDPVKMTVMRSVKQALDPVGILNPGVLMSD